LILWSAPEGWTKTADGCCILKQNSLDTSQEVNSYIKMKTRRETSTNYGGQVTKFSFKENFNKLQCRSTVEMSIPNCCNG
jgi:hypothetical protein